MLGEFTGLGHTVCLVRRAIARRSPAATGADAGGPPSRPFEKQLADKNTFAARPDQVIKTLRAILEETRPSILALWGNDGKVSHKIPWTAFGSWPRGHAGFAGDRRGTGPQEPFERNTPVSLAHNRWRKLHPVAG